MGLRSRSSKNTKPKQKTKEVDPKSDLTEQQQTQQGQQQKRKFLVQRVFKSDIEITPEDAVEAVHWIRQIMGIFIGILFGVLQQKGFPVILLFSASVLILPTGMLSIFHELDLEEINKHKNIQAEGLLPSMALFLLSWTLSYTVFLPQST